MSEAVFRKPAVVIFLLSKWEGEEFTRPMPLCWTKIHYFLYIAIAMGPLQLRDFKMHELGLSYLVQELCFVNPQKTDWDTDWYYRWYVVLEFSLKCWCKHLPSKHILKLTNCRHTSSAYNVTPQMVKSKLQVHDSLQNFAQTSLLYKCMYTARQNYTPQIKTWQQEKRKFSLISSVDEKPRF